MRSNENVFKGHLTFSSNQFIVTFCLEVRKPNPLCDIIVVSQDQKCQQRDPIKLSFRSFNILRDDNPIFLMIGVSQEQNFQHRGPKNLKGHLTFLSNVFVNTIYLEI
jgi:hypothetical protein